MNLRLKLFDVVTFTTERTPDQKIKLTAVVAALNVEVEPEKVAAAAGSSVPLGTAPATPPPEPSATAPSPAREASELEELRREARVLRAEFEFQRRRLADVGEMLKTERAAWEEERRQLLARLSAGAEVRHEVMALIGIAVGNLMTSKPAEATEHLMKAAQTIATGRPTRG